MVTESGFHRAEVVDRAASLVRPQTIDRCGPTAGAAGDFGVLSMYKEVAGEGEVDRSQDKEAFEWWESLVCTPCDQDDDEAVGRPIKLPRNFRKPTKQEVMEHLPSHWPYRSWCKHCVRGRASGSHHQARSDEDREFARSGTPTVSIDHCCLGSEVDEESAHSSPYLIVFDNASEALYALAVPDKACHAWVVEYVYKIVDELGYGGTRIALKSDNAKELMEIRRHVSAKRSAPTVPLHSPVRESKGNGAVENAVRRWQGQFRTLKNQLDTELGGELPREHPVLQ